MNKEVDTSKQKELDNSKAADEKSDVTEDKKSEDTLTKLSQEDLIDIVKATRKEAKGYRLDLKGVKDKLEEIDVAKAQAEEERKKRAGEFEDIISTKNKELEALKPKADLYEEWHSKKVTELKSVFGDDWDDDYAKLSLPKLEKLSKSLKSKKEITDMDNGAGKKQPSDVKLSDADKKQAKIMGLSDKDYFELQQSRITNLEKFKESKK